MGNNSWACNNSSIISSLLKKNSRTFKDLISFQGLSRPGFFFNKFKDFPGFSRTVGTLPNPLAGMDSANSLAGMASANPLAGMDSANPLAGMASANPLAGMDSANPLAGMASGNHMVWNGLCSSVG